LFQANEPQPLFITILMKHYLNSYKRVL